MSGKVGQYDSTLHSVIQTDTVYKTLHCTAVTAQHIYSIAGYIMWGMVEWQRAEKRGYGYLQVICAI